LRPQSLSRSISLGCFFSDGRQLQSSHLLGLVLTRGDSTKSYFSIALLLSYLLLSGFNRTFQLEPQHPTFLGRSHAFSKNRSSHYQYQRPCSGSNSQSKVSLLVVFVTRTKHFSSGATIKLLRSQPVFCKETKVVMMMLSLANL
jgi:hypothetical protein